MPPAQCNDMAFAYVCTVFSITLQSVSKTVNLLIPCFLRISLCKNQNNRLVPWLQKVVLRLQSVSY